MAVVREEYLRLRNQQAAQKNTSWYSNFFLVFIITILPCLAALLSDLYDPSKALWTGKYNKW